MGAGVSAVPRPPSSHPSRVTRDSVAVPDHVRIHTELKQQLAMPNDVCSLSLYWVKEGKAALNLAKVFFPSHEKVFIIRGKLSQTHTTVYSFRKERLSESGNSVLPGLH